MVDTRGYSILFPLIIFLILDIMVVVNTVRQGGDTPLGRKFFKFLSSVAILQLATTLSYSNDLGFFSMGIGLQTVVNMVGVVFLSVTGYYWTTYIFETHPALHAWTSLKRRLLLAIPLAVLVFMCTSSYWTHWIFYIDENGVFQYGKLMGFQLMSYGYYLLALILSVTHRKKGEGIDSVIGKFSTYMIPGLAGGLVNIFLFRGGYAQIGSSVGAILMYMEQFVAEINEMKRLRSIEQVNLQLMQANEEIKAARDEACAASNAKTQFLFNMSHDIRTPMNAVLGCAQVALQHPEDRERVEANLNKIMNSGNHLLNLINGVLEMNRIESGHFAIEETPMDIRHAIRTVSDMGRELAAAKGIRMEVDMGGFSCPYIYADELHINEVIINLISNAVKYSKPEGSVLYRIRQQENSKDGRALFRFEVIDDGIGMSEEFQTHMFESFSRERSYTTTKIEGTGLGLSIVKKIVDLVGGDIAVRSRLNEGSAFTVTIPFRVMNEAEIQAFLAEQSRPEGGETEGQTLTGKRVLYVEDNEINRDIGVDLLTEAGMTVDTAEDGSVAVKILEEMGTEHYDLILMDIQMPVMNGYEAATAIRSLPGGESVPIIALSANAFREDVQKSLDAGMNAHLAKPIKAEQLLQTLSAHLVPKPERSKP